MSFSQTDLDNINAAIASGARVVEQRGRKVEYRSIAELLSARDTIKSALDAASGSSTTGGFGAVASFSDG